MKPADQSSTHPKSSRPKKAAKAEKPAKEGKGKAKGRKWFMLIICINIITS